jgi:tetratricopeptide (TPR) repeat protein
VLGGVELQGKSMGAKPAPKFTDETSADPSSAAAATQGPEVSGNLDVILELGTVLGGRYEILEMLGIGGMGAVYKAHDRELDRVIALKVVRPDLARNPEILQRFKQELLTARQVTHKNVIRIFDLADADGIKFITMEYIAGLDLRRLLADHGKLPVAEAIDIIQQVCAGVAAAHAEGVIHRDLKPGNILRDAQGRIVVMDFGLARTITGDGMTKTGAMMGTVEYMSPEQAKAEKLDVRSDLFTIGLILYELLTGKTPYHADSAIASLLKRTQEAAVPAYQADPAVPRALSDILGKALERDPSQRYQTVQEFIDRLDEYQGKRPPSGRPPSRAIRLPQIASARWAKPALWGLAGVVVLAIAVLAGMMLRGKFNKAPRAAGNKVVTVLVADFTNHTGDPVFDGTLEPMFNVALEGASFINAYNRGTARRLAQKLPHPSDKLDEQAARLVAVSEAVSAVITGEVSQRGDKYNVSAVALDAVTGNVLANAEVSAASKEATLRDIPKLVAPIRKALGDSTPPSVQYDASSGAFNAASLEAVHQEALGVEQQFASKWEEALESFSKAAQLDPNFALAYSGMAAMAVNLGRLQDAERYTKLALEHGDRMTERERYRTRGLYYLTTGDGQKCVEEYGQLVNRYPADRIGQTNLAQCYGQLRNFPKALEAARRAVEIVPKGATQRLNLAFVSCLTGDFQGGERDARAALQLSPSLQGYLNLAESQLGQGQLSQAAEAYHNLEKLGAFGPSKASSGFADLADYEGRFSDAVHMLEEGAAADLAAKNSENAADKFVTLGRIQLLRGQRRLAIAATNKALTIHKGVSVRFLAAQTLVEVGEVAKAQELATSLASELPAEPQAYAKIIEGRLMLKRDAHKAIKAFTEANNLLDTWIGHFELGRAYLETGAFVDADSEFDRCIKRRGEALELLMDGVPTFGYLPPVYYYQGRVREGLKSPAFADSYRTYLSIRGLAGEDPLLPEIRRRLGQ